MSDWKTCESRAPWVINTFLHEIAELRTRAAKIRERARNIDLYIEPAEYLASALDEAADALQSKLDAIRKASTAPEASK